MSNMRQSGTFTSKRARRPLGTSYPKTYYSYGLGWLGEGLGCLAEGLGRIGGAVEEVGRRGEGREVGAME